MIRLQRAATALALPAMLWGCATPSWMCVAPPGPSSVTLIAASDANDDTAVSVDLVFIDDELAAQALSALSAEEYFTRREQLRRDFGDGVRTYSWGLAPGQIVRDAPLRATCNRARTLLFARYATPGEHRQVLGPAAAIVVALGARDFSVEP